MFPEGRKAPTGNEPEILFPYRYADRKTTYKEEYMAAGNKVKAVKNVMKVAALFLAVGAILCAAARGISGYQECW